MLQRRRSFSGRRRRPHQRAKKCSPTHATSTPTRPVRVRMTRVMRAFVPSWPRRVEGIRLVRIQGIRSSSTALSCLHPHRAGRRSLLHLAGSPSGGLLHRVGYRRWRRYPAPASGRPAQSAGTGWGAVRDRLSRAWVRGGAAAGAGGHRATRTQGCGLRLTEAVSVGGDPLQAPGCQAGQDDREGEQDTELGEDVAKIPAVADDFGQAADRPCLGGELGGQLYCW